MTPFTLLGVAPVGACRRAGDRQAAGLRAGRRPDGHARAYPFWPESNHRLRQSFPPARCRLI